MPIKSVIIGTGEARELFEGAKKRMNVMFINNTSGAIVYIISDPKLQASSKNRVVLAYEQFYENTRLKEKRFAYSDTANTEVIVDVS